MKNQGRKSITLSLQVSVIGNIPSGNFKLGSPKEVFLIKNLTDDTLTLTVKPAGNDEFIETKVYPGWNPEIISEIQGAQENQLPIWVLNKKKMSQLIIGVGGSQKQNANLPTNAVISDMVKAIIVTESAPDQQDNILYFEYEPISMMLARSVEKKTISIIAEFLEIPIKNKEVLGNLTLANYTTDKIGRVRILLKNEYPNEVNLNIKEVNGNSVNANNNYFFGDSKVGFNLESNNIMEIPYKLVFNESGYTEIIFSLIKLDSGKVLASEKYGIQIKEN